MKISGQTEACILPAFTSRVGAGGNWLVTLIMGATLLLLLFIRVAWSFPSKDSLTSNINRELYAAGSGMTDKVVRLREGESALFGYGSLISIESLERTLGHRYEGPFVVCTLEGWRRAWDVAMPNHTFFTETSSGRMYPEFILYLNVRPEPKTLLNGILFVVNQSELEAFDRREWIYTREDVTSKIRGADISGGKAYVYVGKADHLLSGVDSPKRAAVRASYLDMLEAGFKALGGAFRADFDASSDPVPAHLVIDDRMDPVQRPSGKKTSASSEGS